MTVLEKTEKLIIRAVIENSIDQLAIVGGTIQLSLPSQGKERSQITSLSVILTLIQPGIQMSTSSR